MQTNTVSIFSEMYLCICVCVCLPLAASAELQYALWADVAETEFDSMEVSAAVICQQSNPVSHMRTHMHTRTHTHTHRHTHTHTVSVSHYNILLTSFIPDISACGDNNKSNGRSLLNHDWWLITHTAKNTEEHAAQFVLCVWRVCTLCFLCQWSWDPAAEVFCIPEPETELLHLLLRYSNSHPGIWHTNTHTCTHNNCQDVKTTNHKWTWI